MKTYKIIRTVFTFFFPIIMIDYYLIVRGVNINTVIVIPIFILLAIKAIKISMTEKNSSFIKFVNIFVGYSLLTIAFYAVNGMPLSCYFQTFRSFIFPILFAYLGCKYSTDNSFNKWYLIGCAFCFLVGFYLYITGPDYYLQYLTSAREGWREDSYINESNILEFSRFSSFFATPYAVSCFSIPALILSLSFAQNQIGGINRPWCYVIAVVSFIAALLCQQRIAMVFGLLVILFFVFYSGVLSGAKSQIRVILVVVIFALLIVNVLSVVSQSEWYDRIFRLLSARFDSMNFSEAMSARTDQYRSFDRQTPLSFIFGLGLGSCGHAAIRAGFKGVADGEYVKLFYEFGVVGCSLLAILILSTLIHGLKHFKLYYPEVLIMLFYLAAAIGSDSLTFFLYSIMFWYSMGRIWNTGYKRMVLDHKKHIL